MFECKVCKEREQRLVDLKLSHKAEVGAVNSHIDSLKEEIMALKTLMGTLQHNTLPTVNIDTRDDSSAVNPPTEEEQELDREAMRLLNGDY